VAATPVTTFCPNDKKNSKNKLIYHNNNIYLLQQGGHFSFVQGFFIIHIYPQGYKNQRGKKNNEICFYDSSLYI